MYHLIGGVPIFFCRRSINQLGPNDNGNDARYILADNTRNGIQQDHYLDDWDSMRTQNQRVQLELINI
ncbi:hypothetical protein V1478_014249 [Vespula squamosa]|uniref:Uncharacterized protein n=1 Tax=Vespula squamosa TaxID=30214 RepID=A0ABD2A7I4_VESSQ